MTLNDLQTNNLIKGRVEGKHFIYTPLHGWATTKLQKKGKVPYDLIDTDGESENDETALLNEVELQNGPKLQAVQSSKSSEI